MAAKMFALLALLALCASTSTATHVPGHLPPVLALVAMNPCMQYCMMQHTFLMNSSMQYCMMQQAFAMGSLASTASLMLQQPLALPLQQCHCGAISSQIIIQTTTTIHV